MLAAGAFGCSKNTQSKRAVYRPSESVGSSSQEKSAKQITTLRDVQPMEELVTSYGSRAALGNGEEFSDSSSLSLSSPSLPPLPELTKLDDPTVVLVNLSVEELESLMKSLGARVQPDESLPEDQYREFMASFLSWARAAGAERLAPRYIPEEIRIEIHGDKKQKDFRIVEENTVSFYYGNMMAFREWFVDGFEYEVGSSESIMGMKVNLLSWDETVRWPVVGTPEEKEFKLNEEVVGRAIRSTYRELVAHGVVMVYSDWTAENWWTDLDEESLPKVENIEYFSRLELLAGMLSFLRYRVNNSEVEGVEYPTRIWIAGSYGNGSRILSSGEKLGHDHLYTFTPWMIRTEALRLVQQIRAESSLKN